MPDWDEEDDQRLLHHFKGAPGDLYTSPGIRRFGLADKEPGRDEDIVALAAYVLDVDRFDRAAPWAHKATNLPETDEDLVAIFGDANVPSVVVETGYGTHLWWAFVEPLLLPDGYAQRIAKQLIADYQRPFIERAAARGWHLDASAVPRHLFRLPGSENAKGDKHGAPRRTVTATEAGGALLTPDPTTAQISVAVEPRKAKVVTTGVPTPGATLETVRDVLRKMRPGDKLQKEIASILKGESFAAAGTRSHTVYAVTGRIAFYCSAKDARLTPEDFAELLRPSLAIWAAEPGAKTTLEEELRRAVKGFRDGLAGFDAARAKEAELNRQAAEAIFPMLRRAGETIGEDNAPSDAEYRATAIIQHDSSFYVRNHGKQNRSMRPGYYGPFKDKALLPICKAFWENSPGFTITHVDEKGIERLKTTPKLMDAYGSPAIKLIGDLALSESHFDLDTRVFHEAICPPRVLEPRFDSQIDEYLKVAFVDGYEKICDWFACVPNLRFPIAAPYLEGPPGTGKGVIANAVGRLWSEMGPVAFERINGNHNDDLKRSPFIVLDEGLPPGKSTSAFIRNLIASVEHSVNPKGLAVLKLRGAVRVMITANNRNVYSQLANENLSEDDADAVAQRFIHFMMTPEAAAWLVDHNGADKALTRSWIEGDLFPRHILWLAQNRKVTPGKRFLVEGESSDVHRALVTRGDNQGLVLEWLARCMTDPNEYKRQATKDKDNTGVKLGDGKFLVNTTAVVKYWETYLARATKNLSTKVIGTVLAGLSHKKTRLDENGPRYHVINTDYVFDFAKGDAQVGDLQAMTTNLTKPLPVSPVQ